MNPTTYRANDGSLWNLCEDQPPIPSRAHDWTWWHDDYDGAPDAHDDRHGTAPTKEAALRGIEEWVAENREEDPDAEARERYDDIQLEAYLEDRHRAV